MNKAGNWDKRAKFMLIWILLNGVGTAATSKLYGAYGEGLLRTPNGNGMLTGLGRCRWNGHHPTRQFSKTVERTHFAGHCALNWGGGWAPLATSLLAEHIRQLYPLYSYKHIQTQWPGLGINVIVMLIIKLTQSHSNAESQAQAQARPHCTTHPSTITAIAFNELVYCDKIMSFWSVAC